MTLITVHEREGGPGGPNATLSFDGQGEYPITITDPFAEEEEQRLGWYFEEHLNFPFTDQVKAREAADSITRYGEALFKQVFATPRAFSRYQTAAEAGLNTLQFEIAGSPEFHRLHWEALKDPELPNPFALDAPMARKNLKPQAIQASLRPSPTINLLIVTARPGVERDVGYRTISRPLVEKLRQASVPVNVELLRPGAYPALARHLEDMRDKHGSGYYHVIHFDAHGALLTYDQLQKGREADRLLYQARYGRDDLPAYEGYKAFLFLEGDKDGKADPVEAGELADLLLAHQVPIVILNACQSGKQVGDAETSLGSRLMLAGMQMVLAMGYSVTVSAAELMMRVLYERLFAGDDPAAAIRRARLELHNQKSRRAYFNQTIDLEDWLLPVAYQNQPLKLTPRAFTPEESQAYYAQQAAQYKEPETQYGFVGRDLDILHIEKRLLARRNLLLVRGMGGAGKTTLLRHLAAWWQVTGFVEQVFYFGYDERAWTRQQIMADIARTLLGEAKFYGEFVPLGLDAQQAFLAERLRAHPHLLILDNLESITGQHLAIQNTLPQAEQDALHRVLRDLAGGRTFVLLGSRGGEDWLATATFADNVYDLPGLDPEAASTLAERILEKHGAAAYRQEMDFRRLLKVLDGYPLPLEVVLANLAKQTPAQVLEALQAGDVRLDRGDAHDKTESILLCIAYSHGNLSPDAQGLLACLAPFTSVISTLYLEEYTEQLRKQPALADLPFERWEEVLREAQNWGLLTLQPDMPGFLRLQPIFPYFLRSRQNVPQHAEVQTAIQTAFRQHYDGLGSIVLGLLLSNDANERQLGQFLAGLEYENFANALELSLDSRASLHNIHGCLTTYIDIAKNHRLGVSLGQRVLEWSKSASVEDLPDVSRVELARVFGDIGNHYVQLRLHKDAEASYRQCLLLVEQTNTLDPKARANLVAITYHQLGMVAQAQRLWTQAEAHYRQALQIFIDFNDHHGQASTYNQLGIVAAEQDQWVQAERHFRQALQICVDFDDRDIQASIYHQLGRVAQAQRQWAQAEAHYRQALQIYVDFDDRYSQASTYHQLGVVAQAPRQWAQAEAHYRQALQIYVDFDDRYSQASTYHQLGVVAQEQRQWAQAEAHYRQALQIYVDFDDRYEQAGTYHQLGRVAEEQRQWAQAEAHYRQALQIFIDFDDRYEQAGTYHQLGIVAQEQRQWAQAEAHYRQALQIYVDFDDRYEQAGTYHQLGRVAEEQRQWAQARDYFLRALETYSSSEDSHNVGIALRSLARLWQASADATLPAAVAAILGATPEEVEQAFRKAIPDDDDDTEAQGEGQPASG